MVKIIACNFHGELIQHIPFLKKRQFGLSWQILKTQGKAQSESLAMQGFYFGL